MSNNIIGRFYFKRTANGNLIGEYSHDTSINNSTESVDLIKSIDGFVGNYESSWIELSSSVKSTLTIKHRAGTNKRIFSLVWKIKNKPVFWGEGFLCDDILIGDYRDFQFVP